MKNPILTLFSALLLCSVLFFVVSCDISNKRAQYLKPTNIEVVGVTKWKDDFRSAYTVTYDSGRPDLHDVENQWLIDRGLIMDYEIVSYNFDRFPFMYGIVKDLAAYGFGIFGHGHKHDDHDQFGYEYSLDSFTQNYESMMAHGILPVSYGYPHGGGDYRKPSRH